MNRPLQWLIAGAFALVFALAGYLIHRWQGGAEQDAVAAGRTVMGAQLMGLDGQPHALAQWRGRVLVVNFWATWCAPCREEIPVFIRFQENYRARGVQFLGIAIDQRERVAPYAREIGINYPVLVGGLETMDFARMVGNRQGVLPFTLVLDRSGKVVASEVGIVKPEKLEKLLHTLL